jgi:serine/threonine protein kinase
MNISSPLAHSFSTSRSDPPAVELSLAPELKPGDIVGEKYLLLRLLGAGGMGQVWMAKNAATGAEVAIKALLPEFASCSDALVRFRDEARATARLTHRGIVQIFDLVESAPGAGSPLFIVLELLRGHTLTERLENQGPLSVAEALAVVLPILSALSHAHGAGVVHRDVKPDNVFLAREPDGKVFPKLLDFGISQLRDWGAMTEAAGLIVGTPLYMAPEQARGDEVDARCDVFGVGVLLYECLTGFNPCRFAEAPDAGEPWTPAPIETIPLPLWKAIARALAVRPDARFSSAAEFASALSVVPLVPKPSPVPLRSSKRAVRALCGLGAALALAAFAYPTIARNAGAREHGQVHALRAPHAFKQLVPDYTALKSEPALPSPRASGMHRGAASRARCRDLLREPGF